MPSMDLSSVSSVVDEIAAKVAASHADRVDKDAMFPMASIDALREAGLLGLVSDERVGGFGLGVRASSLVVERLARECASTASHSDSADSPPRRLRKGGPHHISPAALYIDHKRYGSVAVGAAGAGDRCG